MNSLAFGLFYFYELKLSLGSSFYFAARTMNVIGLLTWLVAHTEETKLKHVL